MSDFVKKPCIHCPYRRDVEPFLTPERGEELAYAAENPYNTFHCHKTLESDDEGTFVGNSSKICAGFLTLQHNILGETLYDNDGFEPNGNVYEDSFEMVAAYGGDER